jgi:formate/nitrite transporter
MDAYSPTEIAGRVNDFCVVKAHLPLLQLALLGMLAGAFIGLGALMFSLVASDASLGFAAGRLLGGLVFSLGLVLVTVAGAELFTGNNLLAMGWASGCVSSGGLLRNWLVVYVGNVVGCLGTVLLVAWSDVAALGGGAVGATAVHVAQAKAELPFGEAFARGLLCNALVCLAVWLVMGGRSVTDKILGLLFPVTAFVALGLEHSIANWFFLPYGLALDAQGVVPVAGIVRNLVAVSLGNIAGGTLLVASVYWVAYLRPERRQEPPSP